MHTEDFCLKCKQYKTLDQFDHWLMEGQPNFFYWCRNCVEEFCETPTPINPPVELKKPLKQSRSRRKFDSIPAHLGHMNEAQLYTRNSRLMNVYGLSHDEYEAMRVKQGGGCAICRKVPTGKNLKGHNKILVVDHCHKSGKVRALLCNYCNNLLGRAKDSPQKLKQKASIYQRAAKYLTEHCE